LKVGVRRWSCTWALEIGRVAKHTQMQCHLPLPRTHKHWRYDTSKCTSKNIRSFVRTYEKEEHNVWYIRFVNSNLLSGRASAWMNQNLYATCVKILELGYRYPCAWSTTCTRIAAFAVALTNSLSHTHTTHTQMVDWFVCVVDWYECGGLIWVWWTDLCVWWTDLCKWWTDLCVWWTDLCVWWTDLCVSCTGIFVGGLICRLGTTCFKDCVQKNK
jgi:hypothetical protein